jgi:predicted unusual protein kinase regulating ubiquinone biosynthesis (AarF/ABC1/UbiB family)
MSKVQISSNEDGRKAAVYVRRPDIEESIAFTLTISERWMKHLREDPEFQDFMDYDYYLASLRDQLEEEIRFDQEAQNSVTLANLYEREPSHQGWKFRGVRRTQP